MEQRAPGHWQEYLIEGASLGMFMVSACLVTVALEHPASPIRQAIDKNWVRRIIIGVGMGLTAIGLIYSPWGKRSGAHMNPAVTLTFWRLGKVEGRDALFYSVAQFLGGITGVLLARTFLRTWMAHPAVNYVVTVPGADGAMAAFSGEVFISCILMLTILIVSNIAKIARYTGLIAGTLVALYITFEAPISGMSMNPARTFGSAFSGRIWTSIWIYFTAPFLGMLLAAEVYLRLRGRSSVACAKLHHENNQRCIFRCAYRKHASEK